MKPTRNQALSAVRTILEYIGEDPDREGLVETPERVVKSWSRLYAGYDQNPAEVLSKSFTQTGYDQMILLGPVEFWSMCEHHMLPFFGSVFVGYLPGPDGKVVGISKLARAVEIFARRLQIQERLTEQIADAVQEYARASGVGVVVQGKHLCMVSRGVEKQKAVMTTSALRGHLLDTPAARSEFLHFVRSSCVSD